MKNTRSYRLAALLLAVMMMIGMLPAAAFAGVDASNTQQNNNGYVFNPAVTGDLTVTYASDGKAVGSTAELNPNRTSTLTLAVKDSNGLPSDAAGKTMVKVDAGFDIDMASFQNSDVNAVFDQNTRWLTFTWKGERKPGFTAVFTIVPKADATRNDISGSRLLIVENNSSRGKQLIAISPTLKKIDNVNRLTGSVVSLYNGSVLATGGSLTTWKFKRVTGDWYSISANGQYLNYGENGNNISLTGTPQYFLYTSEGAGLQFVAFAKDGTKYYLNNKSNDVSKGIQASTYDDQSIKFYDVFKAPAGEAVLMYNTNGGSVANSFEPIMTAAGSKVTLPDYSGKKNNGPFIGWAKVSNIYVAYNGSNNTYTEVYMPGTEFTVPEGQTILYAVFNEKSSKVRFGFRADGKIPDEPGDYKVANYTGHFEIENALKLGKWVVDVDPDKPVEGNHIANAVTANLKIIPSDEVIKTTMPSYDPETMYVHWYVMKYAGQWKIDGVLRTRSSKSVAYQMNVEGGLKESIKNFPMGYELTGQKYIVAGAEADGKVVTPSLEGYTFLGWSTEKDNPQQLYKSGDQIPVTGSINVYAQWEKIPTYDLTFTLGNDKGDNVIPEKASHLENKQIQLPEVEDLDGYIFSGWFANGEKITGDTFTMPAEHVDITGEYYGPIRVTIESDWSDGQAGHEGAQITLTAIPEGPDNLDYTYQWQYIDSAGNWVDVTNATEKTMTYTLNEETSNRIWRVTIPSAKPLNK